MIARRLAWLLVLGLLAGPRRAHANGRFPLAAQLVVDPLDASHVVVRTTFGPVQSTDGGATWRWICERSVGYAGIFDPSLAIAEGGVLFGLTDALARSDDRACSFARVPGEIDAKYVVDLAVARGDPTHVVAITAPAEIGVPGAVSAYFDSRDGGRFFLRFGAAFPPDFVPETVDLAPSRPALVYVSGKRTTSPLGVIMRSEDGGATWEESTFDLGGAKKPFIAAVDPSDPARLFVRLDQEPGDRLVVSEDSGRTFHDVFAATGDLFGFSLSPDGTRVAIGGSIDGVFVATTKDLVFSKASDIEARCLTWSTAGLWACVDETPTTFSVGLSTDEGRTFVPRYRLRDITPLDCPAGTTTGDRCAEDWPAVRTTLGIEDDAGPADAAGDGGGAGDAAVARDGGDAGEQPVGADDSSACSCRSAGRSKARPFVSLALGLAALALGTSSRWRRARSVQTR